MDEEWVEVTWGPEKFAPISFHVIDIGPFTMRTKVKKGETPEEAMMRAWRALDRQGRAVFVEQKAAYLERCSIIATEARERGKRARDQG